MKTLTMAQGSTEWVQARLGLVTASEADALLTPLFKKREGQGVETYLYTKLAEKVLGYSVESGSTFEMGQGQTVEAIARPWFSFNYDLDVSTPGLCVSDDGRIACSPDGMLKDGSGLEVKCPQGPAHLKYFFKNEIPPEYRVQCAFSIYVTEAPYWTFLSFHRQLPPLVVRMERDEKIMALIKDALDGFFITFDFHYGKIKAIQDAENAAKSAAYYAQSDEQKRA
jgi:hypothetical protein